MSVCNVYDIRSSTVANGQLQIVEKVILSS